VLERNIAIRVDEELFKKIKVQLADNGMTMKDYIISLIEEDLLRKI
jgi:predicted DNA binding CopG/RHH family protein